MRDVGMPGPRAATRVLAGQVAVVVGGSRGIGAATAVLLGRCGASVAVAARTGREVSRISRLVFAEGGESIPCTLDVRVPDQVRHLVERLRQRFERLDHVIYCAGHQPDAGFVWDVDPDEMRTALDVNVLGAVLVAREVVPVMLEQNRGTLVFVTSALPRRPIPGLGAYSASRAAENILVRTLAAEVRGSGVRVAAYTPRPTETDALRRFRAGLPGRGSADRPMPGEDPGESAEAIVRLCLPGWRTAGEVTVLPPFRRAARRHPW